MDSVAHLNASLTGRYVVEREIGRGGMATVYIARDLRHDRLVAVKVLNPELGAVLGVERFLSEIRVTANLQHPNLLPLFDSGEAEGMLFYVMPYVEGESLRAKLEREKQLPLDEAIHLAISVASALDYAHRRGVIHRDLKPENILLHEGQPVVADFGIALAVSNAGGNRVTQTGISLGTPHYMSPEQATGDRQLDARADVYSLGAVLYEMLTGDPPYTGSTAQAIIAKVLTDRPRGIRLGRETVPEHVDAAVERALAKLPADRWQTAHDFAEALHGRSVALPAGVITPASLSGRSGPTPPRRVTIASPALWVSALVLALGLGAWGWLRPGTVTTHGPIRFTVDPGVGHSHVDVIQQHIGIAPDGRSILYSAYVAGGPRRVFLRRLDELQARLVDPGLDLLPGFRPAISPDGEWIAFASLGKLRKMPLDGGAPVTVADVSGNADVTWISDEQIAFDQGAGFSRNLWVVSARGGEPQQLTRPDTATGDVSQAWPQMTSIGDLLLYTSLPSAGPARARIGVVSVRTGRQKVLGVNGTRALGVFLDHLVYVGDDGALRAVAFDSRRLEVQGAPILLMEGIHITPTTAVAAISASGTLAYITGSSISQPMVVDERGASQSLLSAERRYAHPRFSPDGGRIAFDITSNESTDIWVAEVRSGTFTKLTSRGNNDRPEWTTDGTRIIYTSDRETDGGFDIWWVPHDGSGQPERLFSGPFSIREVVATPNGRTLLYREDNPATRRDIYILPLQGDRTPRPLLTGAFDELMPRVSPDGRWLAYMSDETRQYEVYVRPFPGPGGRFPVSIGGGTEPLWSRDGKRLFYRQSGGVVAATLGAGPAFAVTRRTRLFGAPFETHPYHANYDVSPGGSGFVMLKTIGDETQLIVVVNWIEELRQRINAR